MIEELEKIGDLKIFFPFYKNILNFFLIKQVNLASASSHSFGFVLTQQATCCIL